MLVLTRKLQEKIRIGDGITITILRTKGKSVRLGIEAPIEVPVVRGELVFEDQVDECYVGKAAEVEGPASVSASDSGRTIASSPCTMPRWETRQPLPSNRQPGQHAAQVSLQRVARPKVTQAIAAPVSPGPLRTMLDRRSLTA